MGDWNAKVGSSQEKDELWNDVCGKHGVEKINETGLLLLSFCSTVNLTIMNTCFEKTRHLQANMATSRYETVALH